MDRAVKVRDRDKRLDIVFAALLEEFTVEFDTLAVGLSLISLRVDSGPCNGKTIDGKTHLSKQTDIFLEMMVHINTLPGGVEVAVFKIQHGALAACYEAPERSIRYHVNVGKAAAIQIVGAFTLIGGCRAAPKKIRRERHNTQLLIIERSLFRFIITRCGGVRPLII